MAQLNQQFVSSFNLVGLNLYSNPLVHDYLDATLAYDGQLIRAVNVNSIPVGAKQKRPGYTTFLGTTQNQGSQINSLWSWTQDNGTQTYVYCFAGSVLGYYDATAGTGTDWIPTGNGTFTGTHVGNAILGNTMIIGDGVGSTRHTTDGINFTNTTLAPAAEFFTQFSGRVYAAQGSPGTCITYSVVADATNWNITGTSDSASIYIPDAGKVQKLFNLANNLFITKNSGRMFRWDGFNLYDLSTQNGPTSPYSYAQIEGMGFWVNRQGIFVSQGDAAQVISNPIQKQIYNDSNTGINNLQFGSAPGVAQFYDYFVSVGSTTDDFTNEPINNCVINYNFQKNEFLNWSLFDQPTAFGTYADGTGKRQLLFGNNAGQVFQFSGTATTDNGNPISSVVELIFTFNQPHLDKDWRWFWGFFNPGAEVQVQVATGDTFTKLKTWTDVGEAKSGVVRYRFPNGLRSKILYVRIKDNSRAARYTCYGFAFGAQIVDPG